MTYHLNIYKEPLPLTEKVSFVAAIYDEDANRICELYDKETAIALANALNATIFYEDF